MAGGIGNRAFRGCEPRKSWLPGHRCWVMHECANAEVMQIGLEGVAPCRQHWKQVVDVSGIDFRWNGDGCFYETVSISGRDNSPAFRPFGQVW